MTRCRRWILAAVLAAAAPAPRARAEDAKGTSPPVKEQVKRGFKETGRAIGRGATAVGHLFRDGAKETWKASRPGREKVKESGREVGRGAARAGKAVGGAATDAGRNVKSAVKGEGEAK